MPRTNLSPAQRFLRDKNPRDRIDRNSHIRYNFRDRRQAGRFLASRLLDYRCLHDVVILAVSRGGVPVAFELAKVLKAPLDVFMFRSPGLTSAVGTDAKRTLLELERLEKVPRIGRQPLDLRGRSVMLVDDGLEPGSIMFHAVDALREREPARIIGVVPVASPAAAEALRQVVDEFICERMPEPFHDTSHWYDDFTETSDEEVALFRTRAPRP